MHGVNLYSVLWPWAKIRLALCDTDAASACARRCASLDYCMPATTLSALHCVAHSMWLQHDAASSKAKPGVNPSARCFWCLSSSALLSSDRPRKAGQYVLHITQHTILCEGCEQKSQAEGGQQMVSASDAAGRRPSVQKSYAHLRLSTFDKLSRSEEAESLDRRDAQISCTQTHTHARSAAQAASQKKA